MRVDEAGFTYGLSQGMVGLGANNSIATIDNVVVQRLAPEVTHTETSDFETPSWMSFSMQGGAWMSSNGWYSGTAMGSDAAVNLINAPVSPAALIMLSGTLNSTGEGGFVFDYYGPDDYKFVTLSPDTNEIIVGHRTAKGLVHDVVYTNSLLGSGDHELSVTLKGSTVSVVADGQLVLSHAFNAIVTDGGFGVLSNSGTTSFDDVTFQTDDDTVSIDGYPDLISLPDRWANDWDSDSDVIGIDYGD